MAIVDDPRTGRAGRSPQIRLAFGALFWRVAALTFVTAEFLVWQWLWRRRRWIRRPQRIVVLIYYMPRSLALAFVVGALVTVTADLLVRIFLRRLIARWLQPPEDLFLGLPAPFHLASNEVLEAEMTARRRVGRSWAPGKLVKTNRRLLFLPFAWEAEPWSLPLDHMRMVRVEPAPRFAFGFVRGLPDRIAIQDADGAWIRFAVTDPSAVLDWFQGLDAVQYLHIGR
ncbi:MAG: hypothetical protein IRY99_16585 [Isosphaeraceae bacterium]|nr:hypothetical protein [Isosphaeraceae bacterium]